MNSGLLGESHVSAPFTQTLTFALSWYFSALNQSAGGNFIHELQIMDKLHIKTKRSTVPFPLTVPLCSAKCGCNVVKLLFQKIAVFSISNNTRAFCMIGSQKSIFRRTEKTIRLCRKKDICTARRCILSVFCILSLLCRSVQYLECFSIKCWYICHKSAVTITMQIHGFQGKFLDRDNKILLSSLM